MVVLTLIHVDVRVIVATNRDLEQEIVNGNFREDLFIFLHYGNGGKIFFCKRIRIFFFKKIRREKLLISEKYMVAIKRYPWKGNVRKLKNTVKRCLVVTEGGNTGLSISAVADAGII